MSAKTMEISWSHYYGVVENLSLLTGLWPFLKPKTRIFRVAVITVIFLTLLIPEIAFQFTCEGDIQCSFLSMTAYLSTFIAAVKVITFQLNIQRFKDLTERLFNDWETLETPEEYDIVRSHAVNCRRFSILYPMYCFLTVYLFMSVSIVPRILDVIIPFNESRPNLLPYPGYYFVDSKKYFYYIYGHSVVSWEIITAGLVAHDCMFVSYVEHVCSMFAVVGRNDAIKDVKCDDTYHKKIALLVHTHRKTLEFAQLLENTFTISFAIQLLIIITTMSYVRRSFLVTSENSCTCYFRHLAGTPLERCRYNSSWYETPVKSRKLLIMTMIQSLRPISLSAGKIYVFSLESFTTVKRDSSWWTMFWNFISFNNGQFLFERFCKLRCRTLRYSHPFNRITLNIKTASGNSAMIQITYGMCPIKLVKLFKRYLHTFAFDGSFYFNIKCASRLEFNFND
ncbi:PREDICTED: putative odorant receptor 71a [Dinoponera quadriceps]|uniref:Odorant receptor n=1 Tax=Dinoponera quadriceps TaxID=609295 RepID=A0A6P3X7B4_DINQU|nr:PREDICTED: putative odorant receptor 71a [Dinoponera quadriceps]